MEVLSDALVHALASLHFGVDYDNEEWADEPPGRDFRLILEIIQQATPVEQDALAAAAERALIAERGSAQSRPEYVEHYEHWMEDVFGDDWEANRRRQRCPVYGRRAGCDRSTERLLPVIEILMRAMRDHADEILIASCDRPDLPDWARRNPHFVFAEYRRQSVTLNQNVTSDGFESVANGIQFLLGEETLIRVDDLLGAFESVSEPRNSEAHEEIERFRATQPRNASAKAVIDQRERRVRISLTPDSTAEPGATSNSRQGD